MWTKEPPTKPGFYWFKWPNGGLEVFELTEWGPFDVNYRRAGLVAAVNAENLPPGEFWSEPIKPPEEQAQPEQPSAPE